MRPRWLLVVAAAAGAAVHARPAAGRAVCCSSNGCASTTEDQGSTSFFWRARAGTHGNRGRRMLLLLSLLSAAGSPSSCCAARGVRGCPYGPWRSTRSVAAGSTTAPPASNHFLPLSRGHAGNRKFSPGDFRHPVARPDRPHQLGPGTSPGLMGVAIREPRGVATAGRWRRWLRLRVLIITVLPLLAAEAASASDVSLCRKDGEVISLQNAGSSGVLTISPEFVGTCTVVLGSGIGLASLSQVISSGDTSLSTLSIYGAWGPLSRRCWTVDRIY